MDKKSIPIISVCIPAYNGEEYIGFAIESVLSQTFKEFELLILDDCSTDRSLEIIHKYKDSRIRVIENKKNIGVEENWNKVLSMAKGKFIKLLCHDDFLYPTCLESQVAVFEDPSNKDINLVSCGRNIIDEKGKKILTRNFKGEKGRLSGLRAIKKTIRSGSNLIGEPTAVLFRAEMLPVVGRFDASIPYYVDLDMWCRMLLQGNIYIIPDPLCVFRISSKSCSVVMAHSQFSEFRRFVKKLEDNPNYQLKLLDKVLGMFMARINEMLRKLIYKIVLRK